MGIFFTDSFLLTSRNSRWNYSFAMFLFFEFTSSRLFANARLIAHFQCSFSSLRMSVSFLFARIDRKWKVKIEKKWGLSCSSSESYAINIVITIHSRVISKNDDIEVYLFIQIDFNFIDKNVFDQRTDNVVVHSDLFFHLFIWMRQTIDEESE